MIDRETDFYRNLFLALDNNAVLRQMDESGVYVPVSCTREFAQMMECEPDEFIRAESREPLSTVHPKDRDKAAYLLTHRVAKDGKNHVIIRKRTFAGNTIWVDLHYAFFEHRGENYAYCNYFDVTDIKENEMRLKAVYEGMNQQLGTLAEGSLTVMRSNLSTGLVEEVQGHDLFDSDKAGAPVKELVKARLSAMPIEEDRKKYIDAFKTDRMIEQYYRGESVSSVVVLERRKSGRLCFVKCTGAARKDPLTGDLVAYCYETEYNAERVSEVLNQKILAGQYDMISYVVDGRYGVVIGDAASIKKGSIFPERRHGVYMDYIKEQVIPAASTKDHDKDELLKALSPEAVERELAAGEPYTVDVVCDISGEKFYKRFMFYSVEREAKFYILLKADTTELQREQRERNAHLKSALDEANQANVAKTAFLSNMSHEIRTPMNAIIGLGSIALKEPGISDRTRDQITRIGESARHLLSLINDILDMSRIESGRMVLKNEEFSFGSMLEQINTMISSQCQQRGLSYDCVIKGKVDGYYIGDDMKLKQVLINILGNSVKFTPPPGSISFTVERVAQYEDKSTMRFVIKDTGIGMDKEYLPRLFEAFSQEDGTTTNAFGGTGLGMAITKNIVEMMNGDISVESEKGKGSEFTVNVTLRNSGRTDDSVDDIHAHELSVLVVDDDPIACEHAKLVLEEIGIFADTALSGAAALDMIRLHYARHESYNLLLIDLHMPGQNGIELSRETRKLVGDDSAIIIVTAYNWDNFLEEAKDAGVDRFMSKPLFAANVLSEIRQAFAQKNISLAKKKHRAELTGRRILLAEDMPVNAEIMKEILKMRGMETEHAENGQLAVDMFADSPVGHYDAVLMDVRMPVMDGLAATSKIRALGRPDAAVVPIIAMTANAFDEDVQRSMQAGMNAHLSKPVEPEKLFETLEELIRD